MHPRFARLNHARALELAPVRRRRRAVRGSTLALLGFAAVLGVDMPRLCSPCVTSKRRQR